MEPAETIPFPSPAPMQAPAPVALATSAANQSFAEMAAYVATGVAVVGFGKQLKSEGLEAGEPDSRAMDAAVRCTTEGIVIALGDAQVPWWAGMAVALGNLYLSMRMGAKPVDTRPTKQAEQQQAAAAAAAAPHTFGQAPAPERPDPRPPEQQQVGLMGLPPVRQTA